MVELVDTRPTPKQQVIEQLLPICNLTMFEQQLECDVFKEQVFGRTQNSREALLPFILSWQQKTV